MVNRISKNYLYASFFCILLIAASAASAGGQKESAEIDISEFPAIKISSPAFNDGESIPQKYTCQGRDVSPPLTWKAGPEGTKSFALICDDPDAPGRTWVHWLIFNLPADARELPEDIGDAKSLAGGVLQGSNDFRNIGYGGPCPPSGTHRYFFTIYALDTVLSLTAGAAKSELLEAMEGHVLAAGELMGTYKKE